MLVTYTEYATDRDLLVSTTYSDTADNCYVPRIGEQVLINNKYYEVLMNVSTPFALSKNNKVVCFLKAV